MASLTGGINGDHEQGGCDARASAGSHPNIGQAGNPPGTVKLADPHTFRDRCQRLNYAPYLQHSATACPARLVSRAPNGKAAVHSQGVRFARDKPSRAKTDCAAHRAVAHCRHCSAATRKRQTGRRDDPVPGAKRSSRLGPPPRPSIRNGTPRTTPLIANRNSA